MHSHQGASGLWQFMRPTALQYGLTIDRWYDGRRDIIAATEAALDYLETLHTRLGQWPWRSLRITPAVHGYSGPCDAQTAAISLP